MENKAAKLTAAYFDSIDFKYDLEGENKEVIITGMSGLDNISSVRILFFFDENQDSVHIIAPKIAKIPESKADQMYKVLNDLNRSFRWVKFYADEEGNIEADADCILDLDSCGKECLEIMERTVNIADSAYPTIMKEIWK